MSLLLRESEPISDLLIAVFASSNRSYRVCTISRIISGERANSCPKKMICLAFSLAKAMFEIVAVVSAMCL